MANAWVRVWHRPLGDQLPQAQPSHASPFAGRRHLQAVRFWLGYALRPTVAPWFGAPQALSPRKTTAQRWALFARCSLFVHVPRWKSQSLTPSCVIRAVGFPTTTVLK